MGFRLQSMKTEYFFFHFHFLARVPINMKQADNPLHFVSQLQTKRSTVMDEEYLSEDAV